MGKWLFGLSQKGIFFQPKDLTYTTYFYTPNLKRIKFMREPDNTLIYFYCKSIDKRKFDNVVLSLRKTDNCDLTIIRSTPAVLRYYTTCFK